MPAHEDWDPERTQQELHKHTHGDDLNPLQMLYNDLQTAFRIMGKNQDKADKEAKEQASLKTEIENLKLQVNTLSTRLWKLLSAVILAVITGGITWFVA